MNGNSRKNWRHLVGVGTLMGSLLMGCGTAGDDGAHDGHDMTQTEGNHAATPTEAAILDLRLPSEIAGENMLRYESADIRIEAGSDTQFCTFFTYEGPDIAVIRSRSAQIKQGGHHVVLSTTTLSPEDYPDGSSHDCSDPNDPAQLTAGSLFIENENEITDELLSFRLSLPEDFGVLLKSGQRLIINSHYINYNNKPILVRDFVELETTAVENIKTWAAPWYNFNDGFELPALQESELDIDCRWRGDYHLLSVIGHMHEWGTKISVDHITEDEISDRLYDVPEWDPDFRDNPPGLFFEPGEYQVKAGDKFVTRCHWYNNEDTALKYPQEMCLSAGMLYPAQSEVGCWRRNDITE